jgi:hypothetical protein
MHGPRISWSRAATEPAGGLLSVRRPARTPRAAGPPGRRAGSRRLGRPPPPRPEQRPRKRPTRRLVPGPSSPLSALLLLALGPAGWAQLDDELRLACRPSEPNCRRHHALSPRRLSPALPRGDGRRPPGPAGPYSDHAGPRGLQPRRPGAGRRAPPRGSLGPAAGGACPPSCTAGTRGRAPSPTPSRALAAAQAPPGMFGSARMPRVDAGPRSPRRKPPVLSRLRTRCAFAPANRPVLALPRPESADCPSRLPPRFLFPGRSPSPHTSRQALTDAWEWHGPTGCLSLSHSGGVDCGHPSPPRVQAPPPLRRRERASPPHAAPPPSLSGAGLLQYRLGCRHCACRRCRRRRPPSERLRRLRRRRRRRRRRSSAGRGLSRPDLSGTP